MYAAFYNRVWIYNLPASEALVYLEEGHKVVRMDSLAIIEGWNDD